MSCTGVWIEEIDQIGIVSGTDAHTLTCWVRSTDITGGLEWYKDADVSALVSDTSVAIYL